MFLNRTNENQKKHPSNIRFVFFGTPAFAVDVLDELERAGFVPALVVTAPDKARGRGMRVSPPAVRVWADACSIPTMQPERIDAHAVRAIKNMGIWDVFVVAAYGLLLPKQLLEVPSKGVLNVHPSLLPRWRGPAPIQSAILHDDATGVSIMLVDEKVDHGPLLATKAVAIPNWPAAARELEHELACEGGALLAEVIAPWVAGELMATPQDHDAATFSRKITKEDGCINLAGDPEENFRKIQAYKDAPGAYFFITKNGKPLRVKITGASFRDGALTIETVIPEGKQEMHYEDFLRMIDR